MNRLVCLLVLLVAVMLAGCSVAIIHPPSASAFMEKSESSFIGNASLTVTLGDIAYGKKDEFYIAREKVGRIENEDWSYSAAEWPIEFSVSLQRSVGYFKYGLGLDFITPYVQAGFVSGYFGVMGWSNLWVWQLEKVEHKYFQWGGGVSIIEQLPMGDNFRFGLTQHLSRNGREAMVVEESSSMLNVGPSAPIFYDEIGCGAYISFIPYYVTRVSLEFRYGRDLTYKRKDYRGNPQKHEKISDVDRYSLSLSFFGW